MAIDLTAVSDAVWYDDAHSTGHAHKSGIGIKDDGVCHVDTDVVFNGTVSAKGNVYFNDRMTCAGGPYQYTNLRELSAATQVADLNRLYIGMHNEYGANCILTVPDPRVEIQHNGGSVQIFSHVAGGTNTDPISIKPDNFSIPIAYVANNYTGVSLAVGEMIYVIWVGGGYRVLQTTGTYIIG